MQLDQQLKQHWQDFIEQQALQADGIAKIDFFSTGNWFIPFTKQWPRERTRLLNLSAREKSAGFVVLSAANKISKIGLRFKTVAVNRCLDPDFDDATIEINGAFCRNPNRTDSWIIELFSRLHTDPSWDELQLDAINEHDFATLNSLVKKYNYFVFVDKITNSYSTNLLQSTADSEVALLSSFSANTRSQIRQSIRQLTHFFGPVNLETAKTPAEVNEWLPKLAEMHTARWSSKSDSKGFNNKNFFQLQLDLAIENLSTGTLRLRKLTAGDICLGYLMNFCWQNRELFYVGAFNYAQAEKFRPGLVMHFLSMSQAIIEGTHIYDFLSGQNRYKESLSTTQSTVYQVRIRRKRFVFVAENGLRRLFKKRKSESHFD
jgi:hypothetical protein